MGTALIRDDGEQLTLSSDVWAALLHVAAERFGWSRAGTEEPGSALWREHCRFSEEFDGECVEWDGDYLDAWGQHVMPIDARSLADSLLRLLEGHPDPKGKLISVNRTGNEVVGPRSGGFDRKDRIMFAHDDHIPQGRVYPLESIGKQEGIGNNRVDDREFSRGRSGGLGALSSIFAAYNAIVFVFETVFNGRHDFFVRCDDDDVAPGILAGFH